MRPARVKRLAAFLGAASLVWAGAFTWLAGRGSTLASPPAPAARGAELFERHCASCHGLDDMRAAARTADDARRRPELEQFLEGHSDATADENRQILDFLAAGQAR